MGVETQTAILLTAAIEATKAGLKATAFRHAAAAIQSQGNASLDKKKRAILENIIRKASKDDKSGKGELPSEDSPCQFCNFEFDQYALTCPNCQQTSAMCFASGLRVTKNGNFSKIGQGIFVRKDFLKAPYSTSNF